MSADTAVAGAPLRVPQAGLLALLGLLTALAPMSTDMYLPAFGAMAAQLRTPVAWIEATLAVYFAGAALGQLLFGPLSDRYGRKPPLLAGLLLFTAASVGCALAPSVEWLLAMRLLQALGASAATVIARAVVTDCFDTLGSARALSRMMMVMGVAPILAPLAGGYLLRLQWPAIFWSLALFGLLCLLLSSGLLHETHPARSPQRAARGWPWRGMAPLLRDPVFMRQTGVGALGLAAMFAYIAGLPFVFISIYGVAPEHYGWPFGSNAVGLVLASQWNARLLRRHGPERLRRFALGALALSTLALLAIGLAAPQRLGWLLPPLFLSVASVGFVGPNSAALALAGQRTRAGLAAALMGGVQFGVFGLAALVVSAWHDGTALPMVGTMALCGVGAWALQPRAGVAS